MNALKRLYGNETLTNIYANNQQYADITFDTPFDGIPFITLTNTNPKIIPSVASISKTGFRIWAYNPTSVDISNATILWRAEKQ